jgi:chloramphenicol-sensitive protein RarD
MRAAYCRWRCSAFLATSKPVLLVLVSVSVLGETLSSRHLATDVPLWFAVGLTALHARRLMRFPLR